MTKPTVEVLLATYNGENYLEEQVISILNQTFMDFVILVSDDGSTDQTLEILDGLVAKNHGKIKIVNREPTHKGVVGNFSDLLELSVAPYLVLSDQDDIWFSHKIESLLPKIQSVENQYGHDHPVLVHSDLTVVDSDLSVLDQSMMHYSGLNPARDSLNNLLVQNVVTGGSCMINRSLAQISSPIPSDALMHDWWIGLIASSMGTIDYLPESTGYYRQHQQNVLGANSFGWKYIIKKFHEIISPESRGILNANISQAEALKEVLRGKLGTSSQLIIDEFISLREGSFFTKRRTLIRNKFLKGKMVQNFGLLLRI